MSNALSFIEVSRRSVILAEARLHGGFGPLSRHPSRSIASSSSTVVVRTGLDALSSAADVLAAAKTASAAEAAVSTKPASADETMKALEENIACLQKEIAMDACSESYGPGCVGSDLEVDQVAACLLAIEASGRAVTPKDALECAGMEATTENIAAFALCVKRRETKFSTIPRGTLGYCAMALRRGVAAVPTHSTQDWRDKLETWGREFDVFRQKWETGSVGEVGVWGGATGVSMNDLEPYVKQYNTFRDQFVAAGGTTNCSAIEGPSSIPWKWIGIGVVVLVVLPLILWQIKTATSLVRGS